MSKKIRLIIGVLLIVAGVALSYFANFQLADVSGFAVTMFGAGLACASIWDKRDKTKQTWLAVLAIVLVGIGAFLLGFGGIAESTMTTVITSIFGIIAVIAGIIATTIQSKNAETAE